MYLFIPLLNFIGLEFALNYPYLIYFVSIIITILTLFFIYTYGRKIAVSKVSIMISAVFFLLTHYVMFLFLEGVWLVQGFLVFTSLIFFVFLYSIFERSTTDVISFSGLSQALLSSIAKVGNKGGSYAVENIIGYFNLLIFFFLSIDVFYLELNTNQKFMWALAFFTVGALFLGYSSLAIFAIPLSLRTALYLSVFLLSLIELFWVVNFLPVSVYSKGALVTFMYYAILGLSRHYLIFGQKEITERVVGRYLVITGIGVALVFLTSRW